MNDVDKSQEFILGVEREIVEQFLVLIRDKYPVVDKANFFLEIHAGTSGSIIAMSNQRDFLSHFCTVLKNKKLKLEAKHAQVSAAEEHFRRAVIECYQKTVEIKLNELLVLHDKYTKKVLPRKGNEIFKDAPDALTIREKLNKINRLRRVGRSSKSQNTWNDNWERGVESYLDALVEIEALHTTFENYTTKASRTNKGWMFGFFLSLLINIIFIYYLVK